MKSNSWTSIKSKKTIDLIIKSSDKVFSKNIRINYIKSDKNEYVLFVPKKIFKLAVQRNKIKRWLRNILSNTNKNYGTIGIYITNKNFLTNSFDNNKKELVNLLNKII